MFAAASTGMSAFGHNCFILPGGAAGPQGTVSKHTMHYYYALLIRALIRPKNSQWILSP